jgi:hypothetical protein
MGWEVDIPRALCTNCNQAEKLDSSPAGPMPGTGETGWSSAAAADGRAGPFRPSKAPGIKCLH